MKATRANPNSYLYQALALMATELRYTKEAREWFMEGTKTIMVSKLCYLIAYVCHSASKLDCKANPRMHA